MNAQGEDVVAGIRNTQQIGGNGQQYAGKSIINSWISLANWKSITRTCRMSSSPSNRGKLWMLQTRNGKRTAASTVKIAVDMANEGLITKEDAVLRVTPDVVDALLHPQFDENAKKKAIVYANGR